MLYTQCPGCGIVFRIVAEQLRTANGQVRCGRCAHVFNALGTLSEEPLDHLGGRHAAPSPVAGHAAQGSPSVALGVRDHRISSDASPEAAAQGFPEVSAEPLEPIATRQELPFEVPENLPDIPAAPAASTPARHPPHRGRPVRRRKSRIWAFASACLLVVLLAQLAWFTRDSWLTEPRLRPLAQSAAALGLPLPPLRDPGPIELLSREIRPHPRLREALLARLSFRNNASLPQTLPRIEVTLFEHGGRIAGQRRFNADEYRTATTPSTLPSGGVLTVELELVDPGDAVTGFQIDFLP
jgi:predicted Zn finger-like uncharacterized protein